MKIVLEKGQRLFFTSDTHYGHSNICRATTNWTDSDSVTRDFKSLEHMNDTLVNRNIKQKTRVVNSGLIIIFSFYNGICNTQSIFYISLYLKLT